MPLKARPSSWIQNPIQRLGSPRSSSKHYSAGETEPLLPLTMSTPPISPGNQNVGGNTGKGTKRNSVLGASRKIVSATVRRPLRAVGRVVGRGGKSTSTPDEEAVDYGAMEVSDAEQSQTSTEIARPIISRSGSSQIIRSSRSISSLDPGVPVLDPDWPVHSTERIMRQILLILAAYIIGAKRPEWLVYVGRVTEYAVTAWGTCVIILVLSYIQKHYPHMINSPGNRHLQLLVEERASPIPKKPSTTETERETSISVPIKQEEPIPLERSLDESIHMDSFNAHPSLNCFYIMDVMTGERVFPNIGELTHISNDWFEMDMLVLIRTPDVDDPSAPAGNTANKKAVDYFRGKQRHFEFQYQIKLKKTVPPGKAVYFSCELDEPIKMGMIQKAFVGAAMAFIKTTNPTFHYSITGSKDKGKDGGYEKPHMAFTVEGSLDRLVVTKPGETPPKLGGLIHEDPESIKKRKKGGTVNWNTTDTYTMALWSAYCDFLEWKVLNLPGIRPFGLSSVLGPQAFNMNMYLIEENRGNDKHYQKDIEKIVDLELSNDKFASLGPSAKVWTSKNGKIRSRPRISAVAIDEKDDETPTNGESNQEMKFNKSNDDINLNEADDDVDDDAETAAELGEGIYMRSGDAVVLREFIVVDGEEITSPLSVANGGGFAVLQEQDVSIIVEKTRRSRRNRLIKSGDTVMFKMIHKKGEETETRYLTIHRGWWLKWVSSAPTKNGYFSIYTHETEFGDKDEKGERSGETQTSFLTMGGSFTLRHKRWSSYHVGVAADPSATYGGRMLGLYNPKADRSNHSSDDQYHSDEGENFEMEGDLPDENKSKVGWMKPLVLSAIDPTSLLPTPSPKINLNLSTTQFGIEVEEVATESPTHNPTTPNYLFSPKNKLKFSNEHASADVPAWIEMMNRTERVRQLTYVVRVIQQTPAKELKSAPANEETELEESGVLEKDPETFIRLRNGRELAQIMRVGQSVRVSYSPEKKNRGTSASMSSTPQAARGNNPPYRHSFQGDGPRTPVTGKRENVLRLSPTGRSSSAGALNLELPVPSLEKDDESEEESVEGNEEEIYMEEVEPNSSEEDVAAESEAESEADSETEVDSTQPAERTERKHGAVHKGKAIIGKVAKTAKSTAVKTVVGTGKLTAKTVVGTGKLTAKTVVGTGKLTGKVAKGTGKVAVGTGKAAMRQSKKVAKGTVNAGKALSVVAGKAVIGPMSRKSKKPPRAEPRTKRINDKEKQILVSKTMKKIEKIEAKSARPPTFLAGELCAPEQSCRTASRILTRMSNVPYMSPAWKKFNDALCSQVETATEQDRWFLEGNSVQLGVTPLSGDKSRGALVHENLVARCLWESHWREEWCGMYNSCLSFYSPLTKSPCLEIAYIDITNVRPLDPGYLSPLPGFPLLVLETAWLCHYIAFKDEEARDTFGEKVEEAIEAHIKQVEESASLQESDLRTARFWQGFQSLSESSLSSGIGKWAKVSCNQKHKERAILNGRRMGFDSLDTNIGDTKNGFVFVEDLLSRALSFSLESLEKDPESFVEFLDLTSQLRLLPLDEIDLSSRHAFCLFANVYHCLLQQAMLLSVNGPLQKKSVEQFMRTSSYEIGGDVFSLAELYCCVLRGKMSRPINPKPPYIEAPRKSNAYKYYALDYNDPRVNFVLNTGDIACPASVPILRPRDVEHQLNKAASVFLRQELVIDTRRRLVILPKVCEVYKNDFGSDALSCLKFCMGGLDEGTASTIRVMMMDESNLVIRYQHTAEQYHTSLKLRGDSAGVQINQVLREFYAATD